MIKLKKWDNIMSLLIRTIKTKKEAEKKSKKKKAKKEETIKEVVEEIKIESLDELNA